MNLALTLARRGQGDVEPNPMVGAVIVRDGVVLGQGWHKKFGGPHAEIEAFADAKRNGADVRGAEMYVTLEPCCHYGKTPPCAKAIIESGVAKVYIAMRDPNPKVDGGGMKMLTDAGIEVVAGICQQDAQTLNQPFVKYITRRRPWVIAKWAQTLDGKIAARDGSSQWISNESSRAIVHELRSRVDAVIVGAGTFFHDNPTLTARLPEGREPHRKAVRVVFGLHKSTRQETESFFRQSNLFKTKDSWQEEFYSRNSQLATRNSKSLAPVWLTWDDGEITDPFTGSVLSESLAVASFPARFDRLLERLAETGATNVLVEGGGRLLGSMLDADFIDEVHAFIAPQLLCGGADAVSPLMGLGAPSISQAKKLVGIKTQLLDGDVYVSGRMRNS